MAFGCTIGSTISWPLDAPLIRAVHIQDALCAAFDIMIMGHCTSMCLLSAKEPQTWLGMVKLAPADAVSGAVTLDTGRVGL